MSRNPLDANDAWQWIVRGWQIFLKNPAISIALAVAYVVSLFVLHLIPLGYLLAALLSPALIAVLLLCARDIDEGRKPSPGQMFRALLDQPRFVQLLLLGVLPLGVMLIRVALHAFHFPALIASLVGVLPSVATACALLYGLPLVTFDNRRTLAAVPESLRACAGQPLAVTVFLGLVLLLALVALVPFGLGLLVYLPVMAGAIYVSYKQVL